VTPPVARHSAIYAGWVRHRRHAPHAHAFRYRLCQLYLDLDEVDTAFSGNRWWSVGRRNLAEFRRADYHGDPAVPLADAVRDTAARALGRRPAGPVRLLTHARYFGYSFNPVSFYYCFQADGTTLDCILAEITNTPWKERHSYVLDVATAARRGAVLEWGFAKDFHVSPFLPMQRDYRWRFEVPGESIRVHMDVLKDGVADFDATLVLDREPLDARALDRVLLRFPLMTARVVAAIHWQALLIWLKRNPVYDHPSKNAA
jgi:hypothetical protein